MTPKDKAQSLVNQFYPLTATFNNSQAKKCAIICVEEILAYIDRINNAKFGIIQTLSKSDWQQVLATIYLSNPNILKLFSLVNLIFNNFIL